MRFFVIVLLVFSTFLSVAQTNIDSLKSVWQDVSKPDTIKIDALHRLAWYGYIFSQPDSAIYFSRIEYNLSDSIKDDFRKANALNTEGVALWLKGDLKSSIELQKKCLGIREKINYEKGIAATLTNLGLVYKDQGNYWKALEYYQKSLKRKEAIGDHKSIANTLNNIGLIYKDLGDFNKALEYHTRALHSLENTKNHNQELGYILHNIGAIYCVSGKYEIALDYYEKSLKLKEENNDDRGIAITYHEMGKLFKNKNEENKALLYFNKSLTINQRIGDKKGIAKALISISELLNDEHNFTEAIKYGNKAVEVSKESGIIIEQRDAYKQLYRSYEAVASFELALANYKDFSLMRDSIVNDHNQKELIWQEFKYAYDKKEAEDSIVFAKQQQIKDLQIAEQKVYIKNENLKQTVLSVFLVMLFLVALIAYSRARQKRKDNAIIKEQKKEIENQNSLLMTRNQEITDFNNTLEEEVKNRTEDLKISILQLNKYQHDLAHNIRAPLARLMGLINLINDDRFDSKENAAILEMLKENSKNFDAVIKEISKDLNDFDDDWDRKMEEESLSNDISTNLDRGLN